MVYGTERNQKLEGAKMASKKIDMLNGPIWNKLIQFALPVAATGILEQLFNASDIAIVGNFSAKAVSTVAVAAVGTNSSVIGLILNLLIGIALGANVVVANAIGMNNEETVHKAVHTAIIMAFAGGILASVAGELLSGPVLRLLRTPPDVLPYALLYLRIYLLGLLVILLYNFEAAIFRSVGETKMPLQALLISGVINVILNLFFVLVLKMTVNGVAIATVVSNLISALILFARLIHSEQVIRVRWEELRFDGKIFKRILQIGLPAGVQSAVFSVANLVIQSAINSLGTVVMAASSAAVNVEIFVYDIMNSFSQACTTFVGQNYGARKLDRCRKVLGLCILEDSVATVIMVVIVLIFGKSLLRIFSGDPQVIDTGYARMLIVFLGYTFSMLYENMAGYLRGFGISMPPAIVTALGVCGVRFFWMWVVFPAHRTFQTIMVVYPVSLSVTAGLILILLLVFRPSRRYARGGEQNS